MIRLVIVEDHAIVRDGLGAIIGAQPDLEVVAAYATGEEAAKNLATDNPDLVLLDVRLPGWDGLQTLQELRTRSPRLKVLMLSSSDRNEAIYQAMKAGAVGFILKKQPRKELLDAIRQGVSGRVPLAAEVSVRLSERISGQGLTAREIEVLQKVAQGCSNKDIAGEMDLSANTVRNYLANIMTKLRATDRAHAVTLALQRGLIEVDEP